MFEISGKAALALSLCVCVCECVCVTLCYSVLQCVSEHRDSTGRPYQEDLYAFDFCSCSNGGAEAVTSSSIFS